MEAGSKHSRKEAIMEAAEIEKMPFEDERERTEFIKQEVEAAVREAVTEIDEQLGEQVDGHTETPGSWYIGFADDLKGGKNLNHLQLNLYSRHDGGTLATVDVTRTRWDATHVPLELGTGEWFLVTSTLPGYRTHIKGNLHFAKATGIESLVWLALAL